MIYRRYRSHVSLTVCFACLLHPSQGNQVFRLLPRSSCDMNTGMISLFNRDQPEFEAGMRFRWTVATSAGGAVGAAFIAVRLKPDEMAVPGGILVLEIPGLAANGVTDLSSQTTGYLVLAATDVEEGGVDQRITKLHIEKVLLPMIGAARRVLDTPSAQATVWYDGAGPQIAAITNNDMLARLDAENIVVNKGSPGRTATEQANDLSRVFPVSVLRLVFTREVQHPSVITHPCHTAPQGRRKSTPGTNGDGNRTPPTSTCCSRRTSGTPSTRNVHSGYLCLPSVSLTLVCNT